MSELPLVWLRSFLQELDSDELDILVMVTVTVVVIVEILGILSAIDAIMKARTSQGAIAWIVPLLLIPFIALPLYWVFGRTKFHGYLVARRAGGSEVQVRVGEWLESYRDEFQTDLAAPTSRFRVCESLAQLPFTGGNAIELLVDGQETFDAIFQGIDEAQKYILVQFFIVKDDEIGGELKRRLIEKAAQGVRVRFLFDEVGSHRLTRSFIRELSEAGVEVRRFFSTKGRRNRFQINFRNHRKIVVIDGHTAYVGGANVGDEYMGRSKRFGAWRDTHVRVSGPCVAGIQMAFAEDWHWATCEVVQDLDWAVQETHDPGLKVLVLPTGPADELETCGLFFTHVIHAAKRRLWIASPYFVPNDDVQTALQLAALRGVDVRILLPSKPDHYSPYLSSFAFIEESEPAGVKFFRYEAGFLHQKVMLVDDDFAAVGTANLDNRSFRLNFEITIAIADKGFADQVENMLKADFDRSRRVVPGQLAHRSFLFRLAVRSARLLAPVQ